MSEYHYYCQFEKTVREAFTQAFMMITAINKKLVKLYCKISKYPLKRLLRGIYTSVLNIKSDFKKKIRKSYRNRNLEFKS